MKKLLFLASGSRNLLLAVLLATGGASAAGYNIPNLPADWWLGQRLELPDARSLALGGVTAAVGSPFGFLANPALVVMRFDQFNTPPLPETNLRPTVGLAGGLGVRTEQRTRMVYDSYDNAIGELAVADNTASSPFVGPVVVQLPIHPLVLGLGALPARDYRYQYRQEIRDDFYHLVRVSELVVSGQQLHAGLALGYDVARIVGLGAGVYYGFGERHLDSVQAGVLSSIYRCRQQGMGIRLGLLFHPGSALRVGIGYTPKTGAVFPKSADSTVLALTEPMSAVLGLNYFAAGQVPTGIYLQLNYDDWRGLDSSPLNSIISLRAGVEHRLLNEVVLRYGFGLHPSAVEPTVQSGSVALGIGFATDLGNVDIGGSLQRRMFTNGPLLPAEPISLRVYQTAWRLAVSISRGF